MAYPSEIPQGSLHNRILTRLPGEEYERLLPYMERVSLSSGEVIYEGGDVIEHVYFPENSVISLLSIMVNGSSVEAGVVGREGMVGIQAFLKGSVAPGRAVVQLAGDAVRVRAEVLSREFRRGGVLQELLLRFTFALFAQVSQSTACHRMHRIQERLSRWLLASHDRVETDELNYTHEFIAEMLGTRRSGISEAAGSLQEAGIILYNRGHITILNRRRLKSISCECYAVVKEEYDRLLGSE